MKYLLLLILSGCSFSFRAGTPKEQEIDNQEQNLETFDECKITCKPFKSFGFYKHECICKF